MKNFLIEITPYNPATSSNVTIRLSRAVVDSSGVILNSQAWTPCIVEAPTLSVGPLYSDGQPQPADMSFGDLRFLINSDLGNSAWSTYSFDGALIKIYYGDLGAAWNQYLQIHQGYCGPISRDGQVATLPLNGMGSVLDKDLLTGTYLGTGGAEGGVDLKGGLKPKAFGECLNVSSVCIDWANQVYQFHDGTASDVVMVYENGYQVNATAQGTYATYAALIAAPLIEGQWAKAPAVGMFRLGGEPKGKITADVRGDATGGYVSTIADIVPRILSIGGVTALQIDSASLASFTDPWCLYAYDQISVGEAANSAFIGIGYLFPNNTGVFRAASFWANRTPTALKADRSALPLVGNVTQLASSPPNHTVRIGAKPCWAVHSDGEISEALKELAAGGLVGTLTNPVHTVATAYDGTIAAGGLNDAGGTFKVYRGSEDISAQCTYAISTSSNVTAAINATTGVYTISAMSADSGVVEFKATFQGTDLLQVYSISKTKAGQDGTVAKVIKLTSDSMIMAYDTTGTLKAGQTVSFTAARSGISSATTWVIRDFSGTSRTVATYMTTSGDTATVTGTQFQAFLTAFGGTVMKVEATAEGQTDRTSITKVRDGAVGSTGSAGADALVAVLTNETHTLSASTTGAVTDYSSASGLMKVYVGSTDVTAQCTFTSVSSANVAGTHNTADNTPTAGAAKGYYAVTSINTSGADTGWMDLTATYNGTPITKRFTVSKAKTGATGATGADGSTGATGPAGTPAVTTVLKPETIQVPAYASGSVSSFSGVATTMQLLVGSTDVSSSFTLTTPSNPQGLTTTIAGKTVTVTGAGAAAGQFGNTAVDSASLTIRATGSGTYAGVVIDKVLTLQKVKGGYEIVSALPTTNNFEGRVVFLTTDDKLYTYTGSVWVASIDTNSSINATQLADGTIAATKFASTIQPVTIVSSVPGTLSTRQIFNTTDGRLYVWNGSAYVAALRSTDTMPAGQVTGQLSDSQLAAISAAKVSGQLSDTQIAAISATKITGQLTNAQIADVAAAKVSGQLTNAQIAAIDAAKVTGTIVESQIASLPTSKLTGTVTDAQVAALSASKITGTITSTQISDNAISTPKLAANAITADKVATNAITTSKMVVTGGNLIANASFESGDFTNWRIWAGPQYMSIINTTTGVAAKALRFTYSGTGALTSSLFAADKAYSDAGSETDGFAVEGGKEYRVAISAKRNAAFVGNFQVIAYFSMPDGSLPSVGTVSATQAGIATGSWTQLTASFVAPANASRCWLYVYLNSWTAGILDVTKLVCNQKASGDLIVDGAITADKIAANSIDATKIVADSITGGQIAANAISTSEIAAGAVTANEIAALTITGAKIAAGTLTADKLVADSITAGQIAANAITSSELAAGAVIAGKIAAGTIVANDIAANTITGAKIAAATITGSQLVANTITAAQIAALTITGAEIQAGAITAAKIAANTITAGQIASAAITSNELAANSVIAGKVAAGAISADAIAANAITTSKLLVTGKGAALNDDPNTMDITAWTFGAGVTVVTDNASPTGKALQMTANDFVRSNVVAIDENKNYNLRIWYRRTVGTAPAYLTVRAMGAGFTDLGSGTGWPGAGSYNYFGLVNATPTSGWTEYQISFGPDETAKLPAGTKYIEVGTLSNYGSTGTQRMTGVRLTEKVNANLVVDGAISARALGVYAPMDNLIANPKGADVTTWGWYYGGEGTDYGLNVYAGYTATGRTAFYLGKPTTGSTTTRASRKFRVEPGKTYAFRGLFSGETSTASGFYVRIKFAASEPTADIVNYNNGSVFGTDYLDVVNNAAISTAPTYREGTFTVPANRNWCSVVIYNWTNGPTNIYFTDLELREVTKAVHIEDGAITANKVAANAITANAIAAGAVTAGKMSVTSLDAISANIGLLRTASSGARTEIENNQIRVYDSNGVMRVRMGIW